MEEKMWQDVFAQLQKTINPPICGLLLAQHDQGHLWVDIAGQPSGDEARRLQAMILVALAGMADVALQPDQIMVELTSEGAADSTKAIAYAAHNDLKRLFVTLRFVASSQEARSLDVPALAMALRESSMIRNALTAFTGICFFNRQGVMVHRHSEFGEVDIVGQDYSFRRYFQRAVKGDTYVSAAFRADIGKQIAVVSVPIVGDDGQVAGVLSGGLDLEGVKSFLSVPVIREGQILGLVAIASPDEAAFGEQELGLLAALAEQVSKGTEGK
ncbi:MAG: GAF domain-containing protein [Anaerolineae bacterium]